MRILVTGGAGFLGSHLCDELIALGHEVVVADNLYTGSKSNISHLLTNPKFEFLRHDITFPLYLEVDAIYNLASPASPIHYQRHPVQTIKTSVIGSVNMLGLAKRLDIPILQASTSEVYGDPQISPQTEEYWGNVNPIGLRGVYDEAKRFAEAMVMAYHRCHGINTHIIRIFNTYGNRMRLDDGRVLPNFMGQALRGDPLTVYGDGSQTRSFCHVDDLVEGIARLIGTDFHEPVNLGNPSEVTILEFASEILALSGSKSSIVYKPLPQDDPKIRKPDISRAKNLLGWEPKIGRSEGLRRTLDHFKKKMGV